MVKKKYVEHGQYVVMDVELSVVVVYRCFDFLWQKKKLSLMEDSNENKNIYYHRGDFPLSRAHFLNIIA